MENELLMTLEAARVNAGFTIAEAAEQFGLHRDTLWRYEQDSTRVPRTFMILVPRVYKVPINNIFFGVKSEYIRRLRVVS